MRFCFILVFGFIIWFAFIAPVRMDIIKDLVSFVDMMKKKKKVFVHCLTRDSIFAEKIKWSSLNNEEDLMLRNSNNNDDNFFLTISTKQITAYISIITLEC